ncbi:tyrosine-type recombinase/integrase [Nibricoccus sp. IMCC34717]|uniref:tyrosine-type recombinase/integrase n=1 Tax=Nibricoccus sp. IMCC34717 TaxID=3034021 RepID=UPI00384C7270
MAPSPPGLSFGMSAMRPFSSDEVEKLTSFLADRDALLLRLGCATGFRISELLSLKVGDVARGHAVRPALAITRAHLKFGRGVRKRSIRSRRVVLGEFIRAEISAYLVSRYGFLEPRSDDLLFPSRIRNRAIGRKSVWRTLRRTALAAGIEAERIGTHSMRKTFAAAVFESSGHDLLVTQRLLGHRSPVTTGRYIEVQEAKLDHLVRSIDFGHREAGIFP